MDLLTDETPDLHQLESLGTLLRDPATRSDLKVSESTFFTVKANGVLSQFLRGEINEQIINSLLRVLINFTADNDVNRTTLINYEPIWENLDQLFSHEGLVMRLLLFYNQFLTEFETPQLVIDRFDQCQLPGHLISYAIEHLLSESLDESLAENQEILFEILASIVNQLKAGEFKFDNALVDPFWQYLLKKLRRECQNVDDEGERLTAIVTVINGVSLLDNLSVNPRTCLEILDYMQDISLLEVQMHDARRMFFTIVGNLTYISVEENAAITALSYLQDLQYDLYFKTSCMLLIGNYVIDGERAQKVRLNIRSVGQIFLVPITDPVQVQAFHFWNNVIDSDIAQELITHPYLATLTNLAVVNGKYYLQSWQVYKKFLKKLITLSFRKSPAQVFDHMELWQTLDQVENLDDLLLMLFEVLMPNIIGPSDGIGPRKFRTKLVEIVGKPLQGSTEALIIDAKLRALGVMTLELLKKQVGLTDFVEKSGCSASLFILDVEKFLIDLQPSIPQAPEPIRNNFQYVKLTWDKLVEQNTGDQTTEGLAS